jgi:hypothetical protein
MENENQKPKKTPFISKQIRPLNKMEMIYLYRLNQVINHKSNKESIAYLRCDVSIDNKIRSLIISRDIIDKIESDHGPICAENMIINAHEWDYIITNVDNNIDRINILKLIPNSDNYLLIAANRDNGFFIVTHFETKSNNDKNLKRLLGRGNVISRVPSVCL